MPFRVRRLTPAAAFAAILVLPPVVLAEEPGTAFDSDFGPLVLSVDGRTVTGHYPDYRGRLLGKVSPSGRYEVTWLQPDSEVRCEKPQLDTHYWGLVTWETDGQGGLRGQWSYCDSPLGSGGAWNARPRAAEQQAAAPAGGGLEDGDFYGVLRFEWGQNAHLNDIQLLAADVTCDGREDRIGGWIDGDSPEGLFYRLMVVTSIDGGAPEGFTASFPIEEGEHDSFCRIGELPEVTLEAETHDRAVVGELFGFDTACTTVIRLDDGMCDSWRLGWLTEPFHGERLVLHRN